MLIGPPCTYAIAFLKRAGIAVAKRPSLLVTRAEDDVVLDVVPVATLEEVAVAEVDAVVVVAVEEAAAELDDDEEDPQPAATSAAVASTAVAPCRINDGKGAMLKGFASWQRGRFGQWS